MTYAMPSNAGKSRFTVKLACNIAFIHKNARTAMQAQTKYQKNAAFAFFLCET